MKEHISRPILFSGQMVRAILDGRKTQTRRVVKAPKHMGHKEIKAACQIDDGSWIFWDHWSADLRIFTRTAYKDGGFFSPYGKSGDRLWVRETWAQHPDGEGILYRATDPGWDDNDSGLRWKPSIHMFRKDSRIDLLIKDIRVERLQDISEEDCLTEGIDEEGEVFNLSQNILDNLGVVPGATHDIPDSSPAKAEFKYLWDSINGKRAGCSWDDNPWVWVVEFKRVDK